ncbi:hypothetical protein HMPREF9394_1617 [Streptococcus sanguinis SK1057]|uniref:hypothetical protein n=1 Tax=Streptococcus sanguinis TaxID=1305 RepID=UPI00020501E2|nr:hypothetical protein [Streptococcus sanguinis]EGF06262.1 hypothetical protein HMPREF9394_1617 [Streptococcus sanguinis SK1057]
MEPTLTSQLLGVCLVATIAFVAVQYVNLRQQKRTVDWKIIGFFLVYAIPLILLERRTSLRIDF